MARWAFSCCCTRVIVCNDLDIYGTAGVINLFWFDFPIFRRRASPCTLNGNNLISLAQQRRNAAALTG